MQQLGHDYDDDPDEANKDASMKKLTPEDPQTHSADVVSENVERLRELFPEAFTEGRIDFDVLKQLLSGVLDERDENYGLNWHGKRRARQLALTPSTGTLRPCPEESVNWDTTQNLMIEGDNLEVLKLLQKSYAGKVKLIYIDPPYNTGNDFVYPDDFRNNIRNYLELTGQADRENGRVSSNTETSGRFHTDWLNMMYPRLHAARNLMREDGLVFISIDDREVARLRCVMDEIFGEENFEGHVHWRRRHNQPNDPTKMLALVAEHVLVYAKNKVAHKDAGVGKLPLTGTFSNPDNDPRGDWSSKPWKVGSDQSGSRYIITTPSGRQYDEEWMGERATFDALLEDNRIVFPKGGDGPPRKKYFRSEREEQGQCATNWWPHDQFGHNQAANRLTERLLGVKNAFSNPKPIELLAGILSVGNVQPGDVVLDFFAGSGTTGHAAMASASTGNGAPRFILVQLPEALDPGVKEQETAARLCADLGLRRTIAELTKERLRRAAKNMRADSPLFSGDFGFRVFKLDRSNIRAWDPSPKDLEAALFDGVEHLREGRTEQDVLYELLLKLGLDLCVPIEDRTIAGKTVHSIGAGTLFVCLPKKVAPKEVEELALGIAGWREELNPAGETTVVFRDSAFADDVAKTNASAILEQHGIENVRSL